MRRPENRKAQEEKSTTTTSLHSMIHGPPSQRLRILNPIPLKKENTERLKVPLGALVPHTLRPRRFQAMAGARPPVRVAPECPGREMSLRAALAGLSRAFPEPQFCGTCREGLGGGSNMSSTSGSLPQAVKTRGTSVCGDGLLRAPTPSAHLHHPQLNSVSASRFASVFRVVGACVCNVS